MADLLGGIILGFVITFVLMAAVTADADRNRCKHGLTFLVDGAVYKCVKSQAQPE